VKIAEIYVATGVSSVSNSDIKNVSATFANVNNTGWTADLQACYKMDSFQDHRSAPSMDHPTGSVNLNHINANVAGDGLEKNGITGKLDVKTDGITVDLNGSQEIEVMAGGITDNELAANSVKAIKLNSDVAGDGLILNGITNALEINPDSSTIEVATDILRVKANGITSNELGSNSVLAIKLNSNVFGAGIIPNPVTNAIDINVDNASVEVAADFLQVKAGGIGKDALATNVISTGLRRVGSGIFTNAITLNPTQVNLGTGTEYYDNSGIGSTPQTIYPTLTTIHSWQNYSFIQFIAYYFVTMNPVGLSNFTLEVYYEYPPHGSGTWKLVVHRAIGINNTVNFQEVNVVPFMVPVASRTDINFKVVWSIASGTPTLDDFYLQADCGFMGWNPS
jgi:hypothetical protein